MTVETQQNHDRFHGKNGMAISTLPSTNSNGVKKSSQQKNEEYKRLTENTMVCNVNLMENSLASR